MEISERTKKILLKEKIVVASLNVYSFEGVKFGDVEYYTLHDGYTSEIKEMMIEDFSIKKMIDLLTL